MGWKYSLASRLVSRDFIDSLKSEPKAFWARILCYTLANRARIKKAKTQGDLKLILGSGSHEVDGWLSVDLHPPASGVRWDLRWKLPFEGGSVRAIHCEHFLEHLQYPDEALHFLSECSRVLTEDGTFRIIVPDLAKYLFAYTQDNVSFWQTTKTLGSPSVEFSTEAEIINQAFRMGGAHKFSYDAKTLHSLLGRCGFLTVTQNENGSGNGLDKKESWRTVESLYVIASKSKSVPVTKVKRLAQRRVKKIKKAA